MIKAARCFFSARRRRTIIWYTDETKEKKELSQVYFRVCEKKFLKKKKATDRDRWEKILLKKKRRRKRKRSKAVKR